MPRFNFNELALSGKADISKIQENFEEIENKAVIPSDFINSTNYSTRLGEDAFPTNNGDNNTAIGFETLFQNQSGSDNTAVGAGTLAGNLDGGYNTAIGSGALGINTTGGRNTAIGYRALRNNTSGGSNIAIGMFALRNNTSGGSNIAIGGSLSENTTGSYNIALGYGALFRNTTGYSNIGIGYQAGKNITTQHHTICIGDNTEVTGDYQMQLGDSSTSVYAYSALNIRSDKRDKDDIQDTDLGLEFIKKLRPVKFKWNFRGEDGYKGNRYHQGLIAQEVKEVMDEMNVDFAGYQDHSINGGADVLTLAYGELITPLIKAVQEQQKIIEDLTAKVNALEK